MSEKIEKLLRLASDMQDFAAPNDDLSALVNAHADDELSFDELDLVAAASAAPKPDFDAFMKMMEKKK